MRHPATFEVLAGSVKFKLGSCTRGPVSLHKPMDPKTFIEQLLFSTVRIEADKDEGVEAATAFIFEYPLNDKSTPFLVTNNHVVKGAKVGRFFFTKSDGQKPQVGNRFDVEIQSFEQQWHPHPRDSIDVAVMPLGPLLNEIANRGVQVFIRALPKRFIPTPQQVADLDALEEIVFVGYPSGIYDVKNLMPIIRRGTTATPLQIDYEGEPAFLVDASVFPGSSGSPVLISNQGGYPTKSGFVVGSRILLLGVIARVFYTESEGKIEIMAVPTGIKPILKTQQMIDLGIVYKANTIIEAVENFLTKVGVSK